MFVFIKNINKIKNSSLGRSQVCIGFVSVLCRRSLWLTRPVKVKVTWHTTKYGDPYSEFVLCIYPIQSAHTQQWTHTHTVNTWSSGQPFMLQAPWGAVGGSVPCSRAPQSWYWGWRERCTFIPPPTILAGPRLELATFRLRVQLSNH